MIEFVPNDQQLKVLGGDGEYHDFAGVAYMGDKPILRLDFGNRRHLECTEDHKLITEAGVVRVCDIPLNSFVYCQNGKRTRLKARTATGRIEPVYDLIEVGDGHKYITNGILSHNCEFVTDDETLINPRFLSKMKWTPPEFYTGTVRWYIEPLPNRTYVVGLDPSVGTGGDNSAIQVFMLPEMIQVAEWQHNLSVAKEQVRKLMQILMFLDDNLRSHPEQIGEPEIYWTVENNNIGEHILGIIEDTGEDRFPGMFVSEKKRKGQTRRFRKGMNTDNKKKLSACAKFKSLVESQRMVINSKNIITELKMFVAGDGSYKGKGSAKDDLIMATLLCVRMLDVVLAWSPDVGDLKEYISDDELYENEPMPVVI